jgi:ABC-type multidrug transport system fused ATPase/permease subunit
MLPALLRHLVDHEFGGQLGGLSLVIPLALVALFAMRGVMGYIATVGLSSVAQRVMMDLRARMFRNLVALPASFFDNRTSGELLSKFTFDVTQVAQAATHCVTVLVKDSIVIIALIVYVLTIEKIRSIATLKLIGAPNGLIVRLIMTQSMLLTLGSFALAYLLRDLIAPGFPRTLGFLPVETAITFAVMLAGGVVASLMAV